MPYNRTHMGGFLKEEGEGSREGSTERRQTQVPGDKSGGSQVKEIEKVRQREREKREKERERKRD